MTSTKQRVILWAILFLSLAGTLGSLYYSNFGDPVANLLSGALFPDRGFYPCNLCWWARIWMYPMVLLSATGLARRDGAALRYVFPLAVLGTLTTLYHTIIQKLPQAAIVPCDAANPCSVAEVSYFGFVTIPMLGLVAFAAITFLCVESWERK